MDQEVDSASFNLYEKREKIFTRRIEGFYQRVRLFTGWPLLLGYFFCPWLLMDGRQAIYFDLPARKFHIFWLTFWPQDFVFLAWALIIAAFALFFVTTLFGRVWCGYTCPQTVWTAIYMWAEQVAEGDRQQRMRLDKAAWSWNKFWRKGLKHGMWLGFALLTGATFVAYFYGARELVADSLNLQLASTAVFWTGFFTLTTYGNAGWLREQVCTYMCPYARFQSAMFDKDTFIVTYDAKRGEPRGARKRSANPADLGMGDCIDCQVCYQVCPTGIDIRKGLQYQCINCALCIDGCNSIMEKMGYNKGLIRYSTLNMLEGKRWTWKRTKVIGYVAAILVMGALFMFTFFSRIPLELDVMRDRGQLYQTVGDGKIQNDYLLRLMNMDSQDHDFTVSVDGLSDYSLLPKSRYRVNAGEIMEIPVRLLTGAEKVSKVNSEITFVIETENGLQALSESRFIGPVPVTTHYEAVQ